MRLLDAAMNAPWAMMPSAVENLLDIAAREHDPQALEAQRATRSRQGERLSLRDNVAIIRAQGPMFKGANLMVEISGATSYEIMRRDLQTALDDKAVDGIMLLIDSPGGEAHGCDELATAIYQARSKKPIWSFVSGFAASGGYWLAAAAERIIVSDLATLGSIGAVLAVTDRRKADEASGISKVEFVSSQSPGKRPDPQTDEGKAKIQKYVDDIGAVFVSAIAKYRGVSALTVINEFGGGGVEVGANAVKRRMADEVGQFEATLSALQARGKRDRPAVEPKALPTTAARVAPTESTSGVRRRYAAYSLLAERAASPTLFAHLRDRTDLGAQDAAALLRAAAQDFANAPQAEDSPTSFLKRKIAAGALGLEAYAVVQSGQIVLKNSIRTGMSDEFWKSTVESTNRRHA